MSFNVLICDDSALARKMARRALPDGFCDRIVEAENGAEALKVLTSQTVDLLLLDLTMPVLDGIGVLQAIKAQQLDVFVIVVSGDVQPAQQAMVRELGALDFLAKPVNRMQLGQVLSQYGLRAAEPA
ncbi:response regulator [Alteromonas sp. CYL-A6]|uniref:response regulator n=1 Tax=Alteromonas nitratireducens TaxID=3390813 RepID=UPI0034C47437